MTTKLNAPVIPAELSDSAPLMVGTSVRIRPYYHVPAGAGTGLRSVRSPWTRVAEIIDVGTYGPFLVTFRPDHRGPWLDTATYTKSEMHAMECRCAACEGDGIHELRGA